MQAKAAGGLRVICTSLGTSGRILDQFKGRSGRQGDAGETFAVLGLFEDLHKDSSAKQILESVMKSKP